MGKPLVVCPLGWIWTVGGNAYVVEDDVVAVKKFLGHMFLHVRRFSSCWSGENEGHDLLRCSDGRYDHVFDIFVGYGLFFLAKGWTLIISCAGK